MSLKECTNEYIKQLSDTKQMYRDLFGKEELDIAMGDYFIRGMNKTMLEFLKQEVERKLREQDGD